MSTALVLTAGVLALLVIEAALVKRSRREIRIRIHVNGTRGKSTVVRYLTAALRDAGIRAAGKITGVVPTIILPDGTQEPIRRRGPARVQEQIAVLRRAASLRCEAVVMECMSVNPALQALESRLLDPTLSVLTNILDDHREEFGSTEEGWVGGLCAFLPRGGVIVSGERRFAAQVEAMASARGTRVTAVASGARETGTVQGDVHPDNVALALRVCEVLGLDCGAAREAILREAGATDRSVIPLSFTGGAVMFLNGFAVNDVPSARAFLERWTRELGGIEHLVVLLNTRADRPLRTIAFAQLCGALPALQGVIITGTHAPAARRALRGAGVPDTSIVRWSPRETRNAAQALAGLGVPGGTVVAGLGNIGGEGFRILNALTQWSSKPSS